MTTKNDYIQLGVANTSCTKSMTRFRAVLYEINELYQKLLKFVNGVGIVAYKSSYDPRTDSIIFDFSPENLRGVRTARLNKATRQSSTMSYNFLLSLDSESKDCKHLRSLTPTRILNEHIHVVDNKLILRLSSREQEHKYNTEPHKPSTDIESQCHKLLQVLPDVLIKRMLDSDDLPTKFANTVEYRTNRDLKALEKTLLGEIAAQQEEMEKKLSDQLAAGLKEMQDQLTDWLNR